jgi:hypothetical protein
MIKNLKFKGALLIGFFMLSQMVVLNSTYLAKWVKSKESTKEYKFAHALIESDLELNTVMRKVLTFPGVQRVKKIEQKKVDSVVSGAITEVEKKIPSSLKVQNYKVLKIIFEKGFQNSKVSLISEYLNRLFEEGKVTISSVNMKKSSQSQMSQWLNDNIILVIIGFMFFLNSMLLIFFSKQVNYQNFLFKKYQRRAAPFEISAFVCLMILTISCLMASSFITQVGIMNMAYSLIFASIICGQMIISHKLYRP